MEKTALNIDIKQEQLKAQEELKKQGIRADIFMLLPRINCSAMANT